MCVAEAAARGARQAQAEDLDRVDIEHVEKVLPQLVCEVQSRFPGSQEKDVGTGLLIPFLHV